MMTKMFELRDRATFIPIIAINLNPHQTPHERERYLLRRCGYRDFQILLCKADGSGRAECDPYSWNDRTFGHAHRYIWENWSRLTTGAVIDVEFILGETSEPKKSEQEDEL